MPQPVEIKLRTESRILEVRFDDGSRHELPFEYLRVFSPSAEVKGHGGGEGTLRMWREQNTLLVEVHDRGHLEEPLIGRTRPGPEQPTGRGLWVVNHLCDLVQIRSAPTGSVVRVHMRLR